ncbi:unnamed protein product, partial [Meganyctiphanes norvegica]
MSHRKKKSYDDIHKYIEHVEDVLLSESSYSTTDSECSGCLHLSRGHSSDSDSPSHDPHRGGGHDRHSRNHITRRILSPSESSFGVLNHNARWESCIRDDAVRSAGSRCLRGFGSSSSGLHCSSLSSFKDDLTGVGMLQQVALLAAGAQPWHRDICTAHNRRLAYAATLAIYVYEVEEGSSEWQLFGILADHRKTITCLDWHPTNEDLLASSSLDQRVCVWSVSRHSVLYAISMCRVPTTLAWCIGHRDLLSFSTQNGPVQLWSYADNTEPYPYREEYGYSNGIITYRWHPTIPGRLVIGHDDGKITVYREDAGRARYSASVEGTDEMEDGSLVAIEWDTCSADYLLMAHKGGSLWLVDINTMKIVTKYTLPLSASVSTVAWLPDAPGMFVTGDEEKGILRVWTVSKSVPVENYQLKDTGFHVLCATRAHASLCMTTDRNDDLPTERKGIMVPNVAVVTLFKDGGVGLYHLRRKQWIFNREHGHTETIFDCSFQPEDSDLLATASFDGSIKIWNINTMETVNTLPNRTNIIYSLSWAPADLNCIVAGTSSGEVFIWDVGKHRILQDIAQHKDKKVFCVAWNHKDSRKIASAGESGFCYVHQVSGTLLQEYRHPGPVYGCDWRDADVLATGCEDGKIRIYNVGKGKRDNVTELKAHQKKVFRVKWNPVYEDILCSGSDDTSVRIWSYSKAQCLQILVGHSDNVRGLAWCPEVPFLLISGSWDRTLRVWDARHGTCLDVVLDHGADVYVFKLHIKLTYLDSKTKNLTQKHLNPSHPPASPYLSHYDITACTLKTDTMRKGNGNRGFGSGLFLCGLRADSLQATLRKTDTEQHDIKRLELFTDLFCGDVRVRNLWDLVNVLQGHTDISKLSPNYTKSIMHHSHLVKCTLAGASEAEMQVSHGRGIANRKQSTTEGQEALAEAYLRCGATLQYCELMVRMQRWDHALALAPSVSVEYWRKLMARHADQLLSDDNEACVPYLLAARDVDKLINFHIGRGHLDKAFAACVALSKNSRSIRKGPPPDVPCRMSVAEMNGENIGVEERTLECARHVAKWHLRRGSPSIAATAMLAVDSVTGALSMLLRGHELELVVAVGRLLGPEGAREGKSAVCDADVPVCHGIVGTAIRYLTYRGIRLNLWELAIDLARTLPE